MSALLGGQHVGLAIPLSRARDPLTSAARFVLGNPKFNFSALLAKSELVASYKLGAFSNGYFSLSLDHLACRNCFE